MYTCRIPTGTCRCIRKHKVKLCNLYRCKPNAEQRAVTGVSVRRGPGPSGPAGPGPGRLLLRWGLLVVAAAVVLVLLAAVLGVAVCRCSGRPCHHTCLQFAAQFALAVSLRPRVVGAALVAAQWLLCCLADGAVRTEGDVGLQAGRPLRPPRRHSRQTLMSCASQYAPVLPALTKQRRRSSG